MRTKKSPIDAVLFDFDGTLTRPGGIDFPSIKKEIGCPPDQPVLEFIDALRDPEDRRRAHEILDRRESESAERCEPGLDAESTVRYLKSLGLGVGLLTRNRRSSIETALKNFKDLDISDFDPVITRDDPIAPKPSPEGVLFAADRWKTDPERIMVVGDFHFDMEAGGRAGAVTVFFVSGISGNGLESKSDFIIHRLSELKPIARSLAPLPAGKLPNDLLQEIMRRIAPEDPNILISPDVGEDVAAVLMTSNDVLVLKSDPITFASDSISEYAVIVNANDIVTVGAEPLWFLATLLLPAGGLTNCAQVFAVISALHAICRKWGITFCGGHTEITDAVNRPVISGMIAGTVARNRLIEKRNMRPGDKVLVTKGVAVEGTAIIARDFEERLAVHGVTPEEIGEAEKLLNSIEIITEARIASENTGVTAMHDVTEGGVATAVEELSLAGGHGIRIDFEQIPVLPVTRLFCDALELDPLGLIGSGSLLICCRPDRCGDLIRSVARAGILISVIGEIREPGTGVAAYESGVPSEWPRFEADEITRLFAKP